MKTALTISSPDDEYEREADRIAEQVISSGDFGSPGIRTHSSTISRKCGPCSSGKELCPECAAEENEEEPPKELGDETEPQTKTKSASKIDQSENLAHNQKVPSIVNEVLQSPGQPLDPATLAFFEPRFGHDFSHVRVHTDSKASESAKAANALAYTVGCDMVFGAGHYAPSLRSGQLLLAHELNHVIQQGSEGPRLQQPISLPERTNFELGRAVEREASPTDNSLEAGHERPHLRLTAHSIQRRPARHAPHPARPATPVCGPNVTSQFRGALRNIEHTFNHWSRRNQLRACRRVLIPVTPGGAPDINGWDTLPLFQGQSNWLRRPPVYVASRNGPCATPTSSDPRNRDPMAPGHEDPSTCSNSVQFENGCWLNGTVNYATFGIMVRSCATQFTMGDLLQAGAQEFGLPSEVGEAVGFLGGVVSLIDWAEGLIQAYKALRGSGTDTADLPVAWVRAFYNGGPSASPPSGPNRPQCQPTCRLDGSLRHWNWVWQPVRPRP